MKKKKRKEFFSAFLYLDHVVYYCRAGLWYATVYGHNLFVGASELLDLINIIY